jgi:hypothetical protein
VWCIGRRESSMLAKGLRPRHVVDLDSPLGQRHKGPAGPARLGSATLWAAECANGIRPYSSVDTSQAAARISIFHLRYLVLSPSNLEKVGIVDARTVELGNRVAH